MGYCSGTVSAFVTKIDPSGSALVYSTYLGGSSGNSGNGIALDSSGDAYVTGYTQSTDFPVTSGAFQTVCGQCTTSHGPAFVSEFNPAGSALVYSTYLGGSGPQGDYGAAIAVNRWGNAYVTGNTSSAVDAFVTKLNRSGSALVYSTYLGGSESENEYGGAIAVDSHNGTTWYSHVHLWNEDIRYDPSIWRESHFDHGGFARGDEHDHSHIQRNFKHYREFWRG
jgi:hypothetical protein